MRRSDRASKAELMRAKGNSPVAIDNFQLLFVDFLSQELERSSKAPLPIRTDAASLVELLTKINAGFR